MDCRRGSPAAGGTLSTKGKRKEERKEGRKKRLIAKYSNGEERKRQKEKMRNSKTFPHEEWGAKPGTFLMTQHVIWPSHRIA